MKTHLTLGNKCFLLLLLLFNTSVAQQILPIIKAKSDRADIKCNGKSLYDSTSWWKIMPEKKPDIYYTDKLGESISFCTDVDSIKVKIDENTVFNFIILLKKDTAYTQIRYFEPYLTTLKKGKLYDENQRRDIPNFTYLNSNNRNLKKIRTGFKLDSIAGGGNEISQLLNVLLSVHNSIRHDGNSDNPLQKNALDLIKVCKTENRGVNCRMLATILNECYLSMGFNSRMVTCMPKAIEFDDCHVIDEVYSTQLKKWIWLDPTFDAYVMNENGELLGIQEVRNRLINGQTLILNPEANWNRQNSELKEHYLDYYMAKNLYRLETVINSTYNSETAEKNKAIEYVQLLPLDGINQEPIVNETRNETTGVTRKTYITNNPEQFWKIK